jgi:hypothetical protein
MIPLAFDTLASLIRTLCIVLRMYVVQNCAESVNKMTRPLFHTALTGEHPREFRVKEFCWFLEQGPGSVQV